VVQKVDFLMMRLLARPLYHEEQPIVAASLAELMAHYQAHPHDAQQLLAYGQAPRDQSLDASTHAAWTMLTNQLMNLDDVLNK
jgi:hypothetical protein